MTIPSTMATGRCPACGGEVDLAERQCRRCGQVLTQRSWAPPADRTPRQVGRPPGYTWSSWLLTGALRNWRGVLAALAVTWLNIPFALLLAAWGLVFAGIYGVFGGARLASDVSELADGIPGLDIMAKVVLFEVGGPFGGLVGAVAGAVVGFVVGIAIPWMLAAEDRSVAGAMAGQLVVLLVVAVLYVLWGIWVEGLRYKIVWGAREPSRRERALLEPILADCAQRLGLAGYPKLLMLDDRDVNAFAGTRHIMITRGFLEEFEYQTEPVAAVLCHELTHWRNADTVAALFERGVALPLYLAYSAVTFIARRAQHPVLQFGLALFFWPLLVTIRYIYVPLQRAGSRAAEYRADQGAVAAGYRNGLRTVLTRFRETFDGARGGWDRAVCASHPPNELRLDRTEEPGVDYPLPDRDGPVRPVPVVVSGLLRD